MLEIGMIIDLTHSTAATRRTVYQLNALFAKKNPTIGLRPLTFSHCGSQALFNQYQIRTGVTRYNHHKYYAVSKSDILAIEKSGGVIGIILENWWLTGVDPRLPEYVGWQLSGIDCVLETIYSINEQTLKKDFSCIAIGTDLDGFTDTPPDFYRYEHFGNLLLRMQNANRFCTVTGQMVPIINKTSIDKIFKGNALRMLKKGWV
jgi:microsomal dipeptidase-like Zn-dependent dipeptidase